MIVAGQQHLNKRIVADLPAPLKTAMDAFMHAPICTVNVALRNWKFLEKLGVSAVRWFDDFGWFFSLRRQMIIDGQEPMPLDPAKPVVITMYNSFCLPGLPVAQQTVAARMALFGMYFKDIELAVRSQFTKMFASAGFDAARDIAAYHGESLGPCLRREPAVLRVRPGRPEGAARRGARGLWPDALRAFRARRRADVGNGGRRGRACGQATDGGCVR